MPAGLSFLPFSPSAAHAWRRPGEHFSGSRKATLDGTLLPRPALPLLP